MLGCDYTSNITIQDVTVTRKMSQNAGASPLIKLEIPITSWLKEVENK